MAKTNGRLFVSDLFSYGWDRWKDQPLSLSGVVIAALVIPYIPATIGIAIGRQEGWLAGALLVLSIGLLALMIMGLLRVSLRAYAGFDAYLGDLFADWRLLPQFMLGLVLYFLIVFGGLLLFIVPGIWLAMKYQFFAYELLSGKNLLQSFAQSGRIVRGKELDLLAFSYVAGSVVTLGMMVVGVGLLVALPVVLVAHVGLFRKLQ